MKHNRHGYWIEEAGEVSPAASLVGERHADIVVIGGGFTGMWAAWHAKALAPEARIVVLEADRCGYGPTGRNGGFCNAMWHFAANMRGRWGDAAALAVGKAAEEAVDAIGAFCAEQEVDAWFQRGGFLQVSTASAHDEALAEAVAGVRELGALSAVEPLSAAEVAARCASPAFRGGAFYPAAAAVQPARLALGLRARLLDAGVEICERSPVRGLRAERGGVEARTAEGVVRGGVAVVAIGGAAKAPRAPLRSSLTVTSSHIVLTEPVPEALEEIGWTGGECITDSRTLLHYFRTTPDGRIAFGWGGGRIEMGARLGGRAEVDEAVVAQARADLLAYFPALSGRRVTHSWGGPIDVSPSHLPVVRPLSDRAFAAAGYTGNGVGPSHMVGRTLASLALERRDEHSRLPFVDAAPARVPPEPFHWLGGEAIRRGVKRKEEAELAGRRPDPISAGLSKLPDLLGFHIGR